MLVVQKEGHLSFGMRFTETPWMIIILRLNSRGKFPMGHVTNDPSGTGYTISNSYLYPMEIILLYTIRPQSRPHLRRYYL